MADLQQTPTSLCCCRKSPPVSGSRASAGGPGPSAGGSGPSAGPSPSAGGPGPSAGGSGPSSGSGPGPSAGDPGPSAGGSGPSSGSGPGSGPSAGGPGPSSGSGPGSGPDSGSGSGPGPPQRRPLVDVASASNFSCFSLKHLHLDLRINFAVKELSGWLVLDLVPLQPGVQSLVLDCHPSLLIQTVDCKVPGLTGQTGLTSLTYRLDPFSDYGSSLNISLPNALKPGRLIQVTVRYSTTDGPAIWWLDSELTCGQTRPLVFTQGHSVCNRSFFPCFDTPAVKSTYTASVRVPEGITVLMSASRSSYSSLDRVFQFSMELPVPSYLVALVAGELQHVDVGPRSRVWAEPCLLPVAVQKLGGSVERWLAVAEQLFGPYLWGRCDIVFLPPSFPIVAMENPCLIFIIASILESSEFLVIDVVHEIAHGWFGNAVTNASWEEMWLSEGLATYAQRRITTQTHGEAFTCLETAVRLDALHRQLRLLGDNNPVEVGSQIGAGSQVSQVSQVSVSPVLRSSACLKCLR
ncbi:Aminopeptidase RNPEPL1 [Dissostichus eleginoides]|uniref:Aminopeptidase RNPEPL1 n=1 Tax=Dissostichus eleginoides TaxID=100907 RepID=A0AAD9FFF1_DISEL|nr:Aminopeptidase RNPEPL1 [Dissostichus eleginoides]